MERDDYLSTMYDAAEKDEMDRGRWHQIDLENEREQMTWEALDACLKAGVSKEHLRTLARETGCTRWINKLKGV
jgi:hypothetical protein